MRLESDYSAAHERIARWAGIALALALHAAVIGTLLKLAPTRTNVSAAASIAVWLIAPPAPEPQTQLARVSEPVPAKPRAALPKPVARAPAISTAPDTPEQSLSPPAPPVPIESARESAAITPARESAGSGPQTPTAALTPPAAAPPPPLVPPNFNADYLANPAPEYPALSRRAGEEGKVVLRVFVSEQGLPAQIEMRASSGYPRLDEAALSTVKHWKFVPARRSDMPVGAWVLVPIAFSLRS
jgi:periplasmic protein TonB